MLFVAVGVGIALSILGAFGIKPLSDFQPTGSFGLLLLASVPIAVVGLVSVAWALYRRSKGGRRADPVGPDIITVAPSTAPRDTTDGGADAAPTSKTCPQCAEEVKAAARLCRFCAYQFEPLTAGTEPPEHVATPNNEGASSVSGSSPASATTKQGTKTLPIALAFIAVVVAVVALMTSGALGAKHTMTGSISVAPVDDGENLEWLRGLVGSGSLKLDEPCITTGGYSDISQGTNVTVRDDAERVVGAGYLTGGTLTYADGAHCTFRFTVDGIPDANFYTIEVGRRGTFTFSAEDLKVLDWSPALTLVN